MFSEGLLIIEHSCYWGVLVRLEKDMGIHEEVYTVYRREGKGDDPAV